MNVWRINLKPGAAQGVDSRQVCIKGRIVGVGWQINYENKPILWDVYYNEAIKEYYNEGDKGWWPALNAIYNRIKVNDLIWTRDTEGIYYLGKISSEWYYETSDICKQADIVNVRGCEWHKIGTIESVPGKLVNSFIPARTVQIVNDPAVNLFSRIIFNESSGIKHYEVTNLKGQDVFSLLSSEDCEDVVGIYLQSKLDYLVVPSSCKNDTVNYEYELKNRLTGKKAVVQVKNGLVDLDASHYYNIESDVYLFTTKGNYLGDKKPNIHFIETEIIRSFIYEFMHLLPDKIKTWVNLTK